MNPKNSTLRNATFTAAILAVLWVVGTNQNPTRSASVNPNRKPQLILAGNTTSDNPGAATATDASLSGGTGFLRSLGRTNDFMYTGGVVFNTELPGAAGQLVLNVYLAVDSDGTGLGTLSDVLNKDINSHLAIEQTTVKGNEVRFEGVVLASNTPERVGRPFIAQGVVMHDFTSLAVALDEGTFTGKGFFVSSRLFRSNDFSAF